MNVHVRRIVFYEYGLYVDVDAIRDYVINTTSGFQVKKILDIRWNKDCTSQSDISGLIGYNQAQNQISLEPILLTHKTFCTHYVHWIYKWSSWIFFQQIMQMKDFKFVPHL